MQTKLEQQIKIESKYSRKHIRQLVQNDVNVDHPIFIALCGTIQLYLDSGINTYDTKINRLAKLASKFTAIELATEVLTIILPIQIVSPIQSLCTQLGTQLGYSSLLDGVKTAAELIAVGEGSGAYTIYHSNDELNDNGTLSVKANFTLSDSTANAIAMTKYLPPLICKPIDWDSTNMNGGSLQGSGSCILGAMNHHSGNQSVDVLNILQSIPWQLNEMVDYVEQPNKELDTHDKEVQFKLMREQSTIVYNELMDHGNKFYFVWKNDSRGRMYSQGHQINLQASQYKKSILDFYDEELIQ